MAGDHVGLRRVRGPPDALLLTRPPPISPHLSQIDAFPTISVSEATVAWTRMAESEQGLETTVKNFSAAVRQCHRRQIYWPSDQHVNTFEEYCLSVFVDPVISLFNQLRPRKLQSNFERQVLLSGQKDCVIVTIRSQDLENQETPVCPPIFAFMPPESLRGSDAQLLISSANWNLLLSAWTVSPHAQVIATDLDIALVVTREPDKNLPSTVFADLGIRGDLCALRIAMAAYLHRSLPEHLSMQCPEEPNDFYTKVPLGPVAYPHLPLQKDEEVFATHHRHSDFEIHTLFRHRERALQFFRWKRHILSNLSPVIAHAGDELQATTHGFSRRYLDITSCFPVEELPHTTAEHIQTTLRPQPFEDMTNELMSSERFTIELTDDTTIDNSFDRMCRTYRCRTASIDGVTVPESHSPTLFLKLFDDRFRLMGDPNERANVLMWWDDWATAEELVRAESSAYNRLRFLQGSLIPYYFGAHSFVLPGGHEIFGILMEDVEAPTLAHGVDQLSRESQAQLTRSLRHAVRALQYANVSQHDWHEDQILWKTINAPDGSSYVHCVLVDFAATSQDTHDVEDRAADDVCEALGELVESDIGMDNELVYSVWEPRETWDTRTGWVYVNGELQKVPDQPDPFEFVYKAT